MNSTQPLHDSLAPHPAAVQWYSSSHLQKLTSSDSLGWTNVELDLAEHGAVSELQYVPYDDHDVISFIMAGTVRGQARSGGVLRQHVSSAGMMFIIPHHTEFGSTWDAPWTNGALRINPRMMSEAAAAVQRGDPDRVEIVPTFFFNNPLLFQLGIQLCTEMQHANPLGPLYAEALTNRLTLLMLRHYSTRPAVKKLPTSRLTSAQLNIVDAYIHAHLEEKITLADLAACLHLSVPHFERMFRTTTRIPPYRYVLEIRLEQARSLLEKTRLPVAEIALQCGFSTQSHFTAHFSRYFGVSPVRFVRGVRQ